MDSVDRVSALELIRAFMVKFEDQLEIRIGKELKPIREVEIPERKIQSHVLQRYFGGSIPHWSNVLYNGEPPTRLDMTCLRASIELKTAEDIREKTNLIRAMQRAADRGGIKGIEGVKRPIQRRDGSQYCMDALTHHSGFSRKAFRVRYK